MGNRWKRGSFIAISICLILVSGCNGNRKKFPKGSSLTIKCLKDVVKDKDNQIEMIVSDFEKAYPNVKINLSLQENTVDEVKAVNEALKQGEGPDIIVGNDLPFQTYAEKGYLLDITDWVNAAEKEMDAKFFSQMKNSFSINGKIYAEPCGFKLYAVQGSDEVVKSSKSAQELAGQIVKEYMLHPEMKVKSGDKDFTGIIYPIEIPECWDTFYEISADKLYYDTYQVNKNEMEELLNSIKEVKDTTYGEHEAELDYEIYRGMESQIGYNIANYYPTALDQACTTPDLFAMQGYCDWKEKAYTFLKNQEGKPYYSTSNVVGVPVSNTNTELAEEFVKYMLTYQESPEYLSTSQTYMQKNLKQKYKMNDTGKESDYTTITPVVHISEKDQKKLLTEMKSAVLIKNEDGAIKRIVTKYAQDYVNDRIGLEEAIQEIEEEVIGYLGT